MKTLIVYDTFFGNTKEIAEAMGNTCAEVGDVEVVKIDEANIKNINDIDLLLVGSPTRGFNPTKPIKDFIKNIPKNKLDNIKVGAFDTRIVLKEANNKLLTFLVGLFGYGAEKIAKLLKKKGGKQVKEPEGFYVETGEKGPLKSGETQRASSWVKDFL